MMSSNEEVCDYCNVRYPDKRSLQVHEFIHVDQEMDHFFSSIGISNKLDYLPKAKKLLPAGTRNNRLIEIYYRKVVMNVPRGGKKYSKVFLLSEAIDELLYLCKKYPVRPSTDPICEKSYQPECDQTPNDEKISFLLSSPPNYAEMTPVFSSDSDSSPAASSSNESSSDDSESEPEQNEELNVDSIEKEQQEDEMNRKVVLENSMELTSNNDSSSESGYGSPSQENYLELIRNDSKVPLPNPDVVDKFTTTEINDLLKNLVSTTVGCENHFKSVIEKSVGFIH